jgi:hypothetical protein
MFSRHFDRPPFVEPLQKELAAGRMISIAPPIAMEGTKQIYGFSLPLLGFNYATMFDLYHFSGYEVFSSEKVRAANLELGPRAAITVEAGNQLNIPADVPLDYLREWGVRWYLIDRAVSIGSTGELKAVATDDRRIVLEDPLAKPFVYWLDTQGPEQLQQRFTTNSIQIASQRETLGPLVVNVLHNPFFRAAIDGRRTGFSETGDNQILLTVPAGAHRIVLTFVDPYFRAGVGITSGFLLVVFAGGLFLRGKKSR